MAEANGRQPSEAPSSSSSDLYTAHPAETTKSQPPTTNGSAMPHAVPHDEGDLSSEMDVSHSSSSVASSEQDSGPPHAGAKRKLEDTDIENESDAVGPQEAVKKPKVSCSLAKPPSPNLLMTAGWPPELWQQVFLYLSPAMLSRCLRVCRSFKFCLTQLKATNIPSKRNAPIARVLDSEALWTQARKNTYSTMPRPLSGFGELQSLQLVGGNSCQSCGKLHVRTPTTKDCPPKLYPSRHLLHLLRIRQHNNGAIEVTVDTLIPLHRVSSIELRTTNSIRFYYARLCENRGEID